MTKESKHMNSDVERELDIPQIVLKVVRDLSMLVGVHNYVRYIDTEYFWDTL